MSDETRVDLHVKVLDERVIERARARGVDVLVYAPHFTRLPTIEERAAAYSTDEVQVVPAREVFTGTWRNRKHVLLVGLEDPVPDYVTLSAAMDEARRQDAVALAPHPEFATVSLEAADIREHRDAVAAVETYNPKHRPRHNRRAQEIARDLDLPAFGSSYAHLRWTVGEVWTDFEAAIDSTESLVTALREGADRTVAHHTGAGHRARCLWELGHLAWENTWQKLDRVLLSGMEATHPGHVAYDGRFEDAAVY